MNIQKMAEDLTRDKARRDSRKCTCAERSRAGKAVPCMACRVANFEAVNSGSHDDDGTWSSDPSQRAGIRDVYER